MKVFFDASNIRGGGGLRHLDNFLDNVELDKQDFIDVWIADDVVVSADISNKNVKIIKISNFRKNILLRILTRIYIQFRLKGMGYDLIFAPGGFIIPAFLPQIVMFRNMQPYDETTYSQHLEIKKALRLTLLKKLYKYSFKHSRATICLTPFAERLVNRLCPMCNTHVIPHGCSDLFRFRNRVCVQYSELKENETLDILYVSSFHIYKNHDLVLKAFSELAKIYPQLRLVLVGKDDTTEGLALKEKIINLSNKGIKIEIKGLLNDEMLIEEYRTANIFLYASTCENMPNILVEAMCSSLPIVCANVEPMASILGNGGVYYEARSSKSLEEVLESLINDKLKQEDISKIAYDESSSFTWEKCAETTYQTIKSVYTQANF